MLLGAGAGDAVDLVARRPRAAEDSGCPFFVVHERLAGVTPSSPWSLPRASSPRRFLGGPRPSHAAPSAAERSRVRRARPVRARERDARARGAHRRAATTSSSGCPRPTPRSPSSAVRRHRRVAARRRRSAACRGARRRRGAGRRVAALPRAPASSRPCSARSPSPCSRRSTGPSPRTARSPCSSRPRSPTPSPGRRTTRASDASRASSRVSSPRGASSRRADLDAIVHNFLRRRARQADLRRRCRAGDAALGASSRRSAARVSSARVLVSQPLRALHSTRVLAMFPRSSTVVLVVGAVTGVLLARGAVGAPTAQSPRRARALPRRDCGGGDAAIRHRGPPTTTASPTSRTPHAGENPYEESAPSRPAVVRQPVVARDGMLRLPGGRFVMGSSSPRAPANERPARPTTVAPVLDRPHRGDRRRVPRLRRHRRLRPAGAHERDVHVSTPAIPSCRSRASTGATPTPTAASPASACRPSASGSTRRAAPVATSFPWGGVASCANAVTLVNDQSGRSCAGRRPASGRTRRARASSGSRI